MKRNVDLEAGGSEVWLCHDVGQLEMLAAVDTALTASTLCPEFPKIA